MKTYLVLIITTIAISGCAALTPGADTPVSDETPGAPANPDYSPRPEDSSFTRGTAFIDSTDLTAMESFPRQFNLAVKGSLPTPCHKLRATISPPDAQGAISVDMYSVVDPMAICAQMVSPFEINLPLGSFPSGKYRLILNGEIIAELIP